ncbi:NAD(P)/FAD-dependent oxidoreductase [Paenibacillus polymyxa]|uniref:NAD(P)H-nitrite reductase n=1 Tax=Paenibacillus polymyxa (strain SC2) TaxID=886882 RepID=E3E7C8_PAEPS|nr:FAD-dependent oxidoreductase [Paenibacillus polymyxa]ADO59139.1 NAD(P)H-nitrite reductase [Paenibacillus polymyxa SC2]WPQ56722.1 FAD-dependent oxidoreductase [Paenibacillus polymyxa]CCI71650.1 putative nitric oxide reductase flavoprotein [Paenibacillus polymyxa M1]
MDNQHYVIIGGGVAAVNAAKAIRDHDELAEISIYGEESSLPYNRVKLSKALFTDLHSDKILIKKEKWFASQRIHVYSGVKIAAIHAEDCTIETANGQTVAYDKLLLCTGAHNRKLVLDGASLRNVHNIRFRQDADRLKTELRQGDRICIIGGGIQGVETAWSFQQAGYAVTILEASQRLMPRQLDEKASAILTRRVIEQGTQVCLGQGVKRITGTDHVEGVELQDGTVIPCEHVVYSIGIVPNTELARQIGLDIGQGILVNAQMETSSAHIYAAGDVAEFHNRVDGLWESAMEQGKIAGTNMAGTSTAYQRPLPVTLSNSYESPLFSIGLVDEQVCDTSLTRENQVSYTRMFIQNGSICGVIGFGDALASLPYKTAIIQGLSPDAPELTKILDDKEN